jgi:hypothetical protein
MYVKNEFEALTATVCKLPEVKEWIKQFKTHPEVRFYSSASKMGKGEESGTHFYDGVHHPFRIIDLILEEGKTKE